MPEIQYTKHAIIEMYTQGIHVSKVEDTIINGEKGVESKRQNKYRAIKRYGGETLHVIFRILDEKTILVINCKLVRV